MQTIPNGFFVGSDRFGIPATSQVLTFKKRSVQRLQHIQPWDKFCFQFPQTPPQWHFTEPFKVVISGNTERQFQYRSISNEVTILGGFPAFSSY